jgi:hypothetical protein
MEIAAAKGMQILADRMVDQASGRLLELSAHIPDYRMSAR